MRSRASVFVAQEQIGRSAGLRHGAADWPDLHRAGGRRSEPQPRQGQLRALRDAVRLCGIGDGADVCCRP